MLTIVLAVVSFGALLAVALYAFVRLFREFRQWQREPKAEPYVPTDDPFTAAPVVPTDTVRLVGALVIFWAAVHLAVVSYWLATGHLVPRALMWVVGGSYVCVAALLSGTGAVCLLRRRPFGRKMIAWGHFLFGVVALIPLAACLIAPSDPRSPDYLRAIGYYLAVVCAVHVAITTALGAAALRAGRPKGWSDALGKVADEPTGPSAESLDQQPPLQM